MLFSYKMLKRLANLPQEISVQEMVQILNTIGFEVESTTYWGDVSGIKFGCVEKVYPNPNSNKLTVCEIIFEDKKRIIQTTATNMKVGMQIVAFVDGSKLGKMKIKSRDMADVVSEGMLTSLNELGADPKLLSKEMVDNIQEYPKTDLKKDPIEELDLQDYIIDVDVLSNRSDANSYLIMAQELAAYFQTKFKPLILNKPSLDSNIKAINGISKSLVFVESKNDFEISILEKLLLVKGKIKTISNVVDLTNLTLIMTGQPIHAYDKNKVGNQFSSKLYTGKVTILGNKEVQLTNNLVIENNNKPVAIAGIIGLENTAINNKSENIVFELARFYIKDIRNSSKTLKLATNASIQNFKKLGIGTTELACQYLSSKLKTFSKPINLSKTNAQEINFIEESVNKMAGFSISLETKYKKVIKALEELGFQFIKDKVIIPHYRHDILNQEDINEEIFRFYGFDNFKPIACSQIPFKVNVIQNLKNRIASQGYQEVMTYTLISQDENIINPFEFNKNIKLATFVSKTREVIRNSLAHSLLEVVEYNQKRKIEDISIFTEGMISDGIKVIALASNVKSFENIKSDVINLLPKNIKFIKTNNVSLHPGFSAYITLEGQRIGWIGQVHPSLNKSNVFIAEFKVLKLNNIKKFKQYDLVPLKTRDITFELNKHENIQKYIDELETLDLYSIKVVDTFYDSKSKITIRVIAQDKVIKIIDQKYNH